ncbi:hypothetical protein NDU88_002408 [Pleurodeles waltl]|uniref:Uncharacterized protein n=1 Tax=Pleurodeles waltl TaxID=8319 RepID=A0AAV7UD45_PLEWA|nr:hypothetical protein NDU88_002408 [Pleurodeles waltl]
MGTADKRQAKLSFSGGEKRGAIPAPRTGDADAEEGSPEMSVRAMFMELKTSLVGIDAKLDQVTERLDRIRSRVDEHDARFETLETRTSEIEDARSGDREQIAQMEPKLRVRHEGKVLYFSDPKQANKFVRRLPRQRGAEAPGGVSPEDASLSDND